MKNTIQDMERIKGKLLYCECNGSRVVDISEKTNLSRPAVSHHIQILKQARVRLPHGRGRKFHH